VNTTRPLERNAPGLALDARAANPDGQSGAPHHRAALLGVLGVTTAAVWLGWVGWRTLSGEHDLWHAIATQRASMAGPAVLIVVAAIFMAERRWPAVRRPTLARAHLIDAGYLALFALVIAPLVTLIDTGLAVVAARQARFVIVGRLPVVPQVVVVITILVAMDAMNWLAHGANHRFGGLWRLHAVHHSQEDMSVFTTFRTHPLVHASYLPAIIPALVLGASGPVPTSALVAYGCFVALAHANLPWTFGPLGRVLVSPAYHRLHHARTPLDARGAVNFGFVLVGWDRLAGRAVMPHGEAPVVTGIAGRPVPIEQTGGPLRATGVIAAQWLQPFGARAAMDGPA
jgi:sterol desaturase/sphingolipid hydroxylase (fatty acid hydroxylase superfamily)